MLPFSLLFLCGDVLLQQYSHLPSIYWVIGIMLFTFATQCIPAINIRRYPKSIYIIAFILGFTWAFIYAHNQLSWVLPRDLEGKTIVITGNILSIPDTSDHNTAFLFNLKTINNSPAHGIVKLSWHFTNKKLNVGDEWQFGVRLKRIHGMMNPGGFDYEAWAFQEGIRAQGYVHPKSKNTLINHHWYQYPLAQIRQKLKEKIDTALPKSETSPWITALAIGERHGISQDNWEVLRNTGTNHLMAIAGLHIGFMSGFAFAFVGWLWRRAPSLTLKFPSQHAGAVGALIMALIYSMLAGFSIPTQRACLMLSVFLTVLLLRRKSSTWEAWSLALILVLIINPLDVLTESFWLSFGSVALIIYGVGGRLNPKGVWWKLGRIQWVAALGLVPLSLWLFQQCSLISFIANSIAIPWVGFIIVPAVLLGCFSFLFSVKLGGLILLFADKNLCLLWSVLNYFSHISWASWYHAIPNHWVLLIACLGIVILLVPVGFPGRWMGIIWLLPLIFYQPLKPKLGEVWLTMLDVGQGLSAIVQTQKHILIFDTGPRLSDSYDMGSSVVLPFIRTLNANHIDMMVVSHGDNDHIGGAAVILKQIPVISIRTSVPEKFLLNHADYCFRNQSWRWDGVTFTFLYPTSENLNLNNDSSCVLKISSGDQSILLTGDIEKYAEKYLTANNNQDLHSTILIAPHHGSKTSAENAFLNAVHPEYVLFPVGYRNRYHFPHVKVLEKYRQLQVKQFDSVSGGAVQFKLALDNSINQPDLYRVGHLRYWYD